MGRGRFGHIGGVHFVRPQIVNVIAIEQFLIALLLVGYGKQPKYLYRYVALLAYITTAELPISEMHTNNSFSSEPGG